MTWWVQRVGKWCIVFENSRNDILDYDSTSRSDANLTLENWRVAVRSLSAAQCAQRLGQWSDRHCFARQFVTLCQDGTRASPYLVIMLGIMSLQWIISFTILMASHLIFWLGETWLLSFLFYTNMFLHCAFVGIRLATEARKIEFARSTKGTQEWGQLSWEWMKSRT
jgi:hypothetical protein